MKNIQIISNPRNGSTYLQRILCHHLMNENPEYTGINEPFLIPSEITGKNNITDFFTRQLTAIEDNVPVVMKTHITQIVDLKEYDVIDHYYHTQYYTVVIIRKDVFESALSLAIADIKKEFVEYHNFDKVEITEKMIIAYVENQLWDLKYICKNEFRIPYNEIIFMEDLTFDPVTDYHNMKLCSQPIELLKPFDISKLKAPNKTAIVDNYDFLRNVATEYLSTKKYEYATFDGTMLCNIKFDMCQ